MTAYWSIDDIFPIKVVNKTNISISNLFDINVESNSLIFKSSQLKMSIKFWNKSTKAYPYSTLYKIFVPKWSSEHFTTYSIGLLISSKQSNDRIY